MHKQEKPDTRGRILDVSTALFSQKGFASTRVDEIAKGAGVNKALIYYYFPGKEAILDHLVDTFFEEMTSIGLGFVRESIVRLIEMGRLDILPDRFHFASAEDMRLFCEDIRAYYTRMIDHLLDRRSVLRIIMMESLAGGKHQGALFRFFHLTEQRTDNPLYQTIYEADHDLAYTDDAILRKFFFSLMPLSTFVVYFAEYRALSGQDDASLKDGFLRALMSLWLGFFDGQDIVMQPDLSAVWSEGGG